MVSSELLSREIMQHKRDKENLDKEIARKKSLINKKNRQIKDLEKNIDKIEKYIDEIPKDLSGVPLDPLDVNKLDQFNENISDSKDNINILNGEIATLQTEVTTLEGQVRFHKKEKKDKQKIRNTAEKAQMVGEDGRFKKMLHWANKYTVRMFREDVPRRHQPATLAALIMLAAFTGKTLNNNFQVMRDNVKANTEATSDNYDNNKKTEEKIKENNKEDNKKQDANSEINSENNKKDKVVRSEDFSYEDETKSQEDIQDETSEVHIPRLKKKKGDRLEILDNNREETVVSSNKENIEINNTISPQQKEYYKRNPTSLPGYNPQGKCGFQYNGQAIRFDTVKDMEFAKNVLDVHYMDN